MIISIHVEKKNYIACMNYNNLKKVQVNKFIDLIII